MNLLKSIAQSFVTLALPTIKAALLAQASLLAAEPKYSAVASVLLPFVDELVGNWTIKL